MATSICLPLFPLGTVLYPGAILPLHVFEERYRKLMREHRDDDPIFGVVLTKTGREVEDEPDTHPVGTAASLLGARRSVDGRYDIAVQGTQRFRILAGDWSRSYLTADVEWLDEPTGDFRRAEQLRDDVMSAFSSFLDAIVRSTGVEIPDEGLPWDPVEFSYAIAARLPVDNRERQTVLEAPDGEQRLAELLAILKRERRLLLNTGAGGAALAHPGHGFSPN